MTVNETNINQRKNEVDMRNYRSLWTSTMSKADTMY